MRKPGEAGGTGVALLPIAGWLTAALAILLAVSAWVYALGNRSGHTGVRPLLLGLALLPGLAVGLAGAFRPPPTSISFRLAAVVSASGMLASIALPALGVIREYSDWIARGMPPPPAWSTPLLLGWAAGTGLAAWLACRRH